MSSGQGVWKGDDAACIAAVGLATPDYTVSQNEAVHFLLQHYGEDLNSRSRRIIKKVFAHPGITQRKLALEKLACLVEENQDQRMARFTDQAVQLASLAIRRALAQASLNARQITALVVNTCTGYVCPGLSTYLIQSLGFSERLQAYDLVGSGCGGAIPNLQLGASLLRPDNGGAVLCVSVEICSATFQMADDLSLIISNAIFADGAAAAVVARPPGEWRLVASAGRIAPSHREAVRYVYKNGRLHNQLAVDLPGLVSRYAAQVVTDVLSATGLGHEDIAFWAIHPGGDKIIAAVQEGLRLTEAQIRPTRTILSEYGNMSSPTVFFVLGEIEKEEITKGDYCLMVAFGAGLSAYALLLRKS